MKFWLAALTTILASAPCLAASASKITPTSPTTYRFPANCSPAPTVLLRARSDRTPLAIRAVSSYPAGLSWTLTWSKPERSGPDQLDDEWTATGKLEGAGCPDKPTKLDLAVIFGTVANDSTTVTIVINPGAPALLAPEHWTIPIITYPILSSFLWKGDNIIEIPVREGSHYASIKNLSAASVGQLIDSQNVTSDVTIGPSLPKAELGLGSAGTIQIPLSAPPWPGTYKARIALFGDGLANETNVDLTVEARTTRWLLLLTVLIGIVGGFGFNVWLKKLIASDEARLKAREASAAIIAQAVRIKDPVVQEQLTSISSGLVATIDSDPTASTVDSTIAGEQAKATALRASAELAATDLKAAILQMRSLIAPSGQPQTIANRLAPMTESFNEIAGQATEGLTTDAKQAFDAFEQQLPGMVAEALRPWLRTLHDALVTIGKWSDAFSEPEKTRTALLVRVVAAASMDGTDLAKECRSIAIQLTEWLDLTGRGPVAEALEKGARDAAAANAPLAELLADLALRVRTLLNEDPLTTLREIVEIRRRADQTLQVLCKGDATVLNHLNNGDVSSAIAALGAKADAQTTTPTSVPSGPLGSPTLNFNVSVEVKPRIVATRLLSVGQEAQARLIWPLNSRKSSDTIEWTIDQQKVQFNLNTNPDLLVFTRNKPGTYHVCVVIGKNIVGSTDVQFVEKPALPNMSKTIFEKRLATSNFANQMLAGVFTVFSGYLIFSPTWFGTAGDYFSVLAWGLFGQFGMSRLTDITSPIVKRTLPA